MTHAGLMQAAYNLKLMSLEYPEFLDAYRNAC